MVGILGRSAIVAQVVVVSAQFGEHKGGQFRVVGSAGALGPISDQVLEAARLRWLSRYPCERRPEKWCDAVR